MNQTVGGNVPVKSYARRWVQKRQTILMFIFFGGVALLEVFPGIVSSEVKPRSFIFISLFIGLAISHYWLWWTPHTISVFENGEVEFASSLRRKKFMLNRIQSIAPASRPQFLDVKSDDSTFGIFHQFDDLHDFIARVKGANPNADIRGC